MTSSPNLHFTTSMDAPLRRRGRSSARCLNVCRARTTRHDHCRSRSARRDSARLRHLQVRTGDDKAPRFTTRSKPASLTGTSRFRAVERLSVCKRPCTVALAAPGKWTYVVGDLSREANVEDIVTAARRYAAAPDGLVPWRERPLPFRKGVISRTPPLAPVLTR